MASLGFIVHFITGKEGGAEHSDSRLVNLIVEIGRNKCNRVRFYTRRNKEDIVLICCDWLFVLSGNHIGLQKDECSHNVSIMAICM